MTENVEIMRCIKDTFLKLIKLIGLLFKSRNLVIVPFYISVRLIFSTKKKTTCVYCERQIHGRREEDSLQSTLLWHYPRRGR